MYYSQLEEICRCLYGRSWKSQFSADLMIDRRRIQNWKKSRNIPSFVEKELSELVTRRKFEIAYVDNFFYSDIDSFYHHTHYLNGIRHAVDENKMQSEYAIKFFTKNQVWRVKQNVKKMYKEGYSLEEIKECISADFLNENNISDIYSEDVELREIAQEAGADAYLDVIQFAESLFENG